MGLSGCHINERAGAQSFHEIGPFEPFTLRGVGCWCVLNFNAMVVLPNFIGRMKKAEEGVCVDCPSVELFKSTFSSLAG